MKRLKIGRGAAGIQVQPDGARDYVACTPDDYVVIIDLNFLEVIGHIDAGKQFDGMAWVVRHTSSLRARQRRGGHDPGSRA